MKPILILGPGRTGKTTLAYLLRQKLPAYDVLHADSLRSAIMNQLPPRFPNELLHYEQNSYYADLLLGLVSEHLRQSPVTSSIILDGGIISPSHLATQPLFDNSVCFYLGHGHLSPEQIFTMIRTHDSPNDWTAQLSDSELHAKTARFAALDDTYRTEAALVGIPYIDTHENRDQILRQLADEISQNL